MLRSWLPTAAEWAPTIGRAYFHNVAFIGRVELMVKKMLTRATRHGLTARLGYDAHVGVVFIMLTPRSNSGASSKGLQALHGQSRKRTEL
jgi:hypothetical protein